MIARAASRGSGLGLKLIALAVVVAGGFVGWCLATREIDSSVPDVARTSALITQGEYLTRAADCAACRS
jgi:hypothetical protein